MKKQCEFVLVGVLLLVGTVFGQGMPREARENIHQLFQNHDKIVRKVDTTDSGYVALTESEDPKIAAVLKEHYKQMNRRLESGLMVRRWDPAFAEYATYFDDMEHKFEPTEKGLRLTVVGKTPAAVQVARNHAAIISKFVAYGWAEHDKSHPQAIPPDEDAEAPEASPARKGCCGAKCCQK